METKNEGSAWQDLMRSGGTKRGVYKKKAVEENSKEIESSAEDNTEKEKILRKSQIQIGRRVVEFLEGSKAEHREENTFKEERRGPGRPKKASEDKVKVVSIKLAPQYLSYLQRVEFAAKKTKGAGGKIRHIIEEFLKYQKREKEQLLVLKNALARVKDQLDKYAKLFERKEKCEESEKIRTEMEKSMGQVKLLLSLLKYDLGDLKGVLSVKERDLLNFTLTWEKGKEEGGHENQ